MNQCRFDGALQLQPGGVQFQVHAVALILCRSDTRVGLGRILSRWSRQRDGLKCVTILAGSSVVKDAFNAALHRTDNVVDQSLLCRGIHQAEQAMQVCHIHERSVQGDIADLRAVSLETLSQMVAEGLGSTLLPALALKSAAVKDKNQKGQSRLKYSTYQKSIDSDPFGSFGCSIYKVSFAGSILSFVQASLIV